MPEEMERLYTINFSKVYKVGPKTRRTSRLIKHIREFVARHMKAEQDRVWIDQSVNQAMWAKGILKTPRNIRIKATKFEDGVVEITMPETEKKEETVAEHKEKAKEKQEEVEKKG